MANGTVIITASISLTSRIITSCLNFVNFFCSSPVLTAQSFSAPSSVTVIFYYPFKILFVLSTLLNMCQTLCQLFSFFFTVPVYELHDPAALLPHLVCKKDHPPGFHRNHKKNSEFRILPASDSGTDFRSVH